MRWRTSTFLAQGRNRSEFFKRLKNNNINLYKIKILSENFMEITIDSKDCLKYFAICENMWYNKLVKEGGLVYPLVFIKHNFIICLGIILFFATCFILDNLYLQSSYLNDSVYFKKQIINCVNEYGLTKYSFIKKDTINKIKNDLYSQCENCAFIQVYKRGNKVVFDIKKFDQNASVINPLKKDLIASEDIKIINITVYSGTPLVKSNDVVSKGDVIAGAYYIQDDKKISCDLICLVLCECNFSFSYKCITKIDDVMISRAVASAKLMLGDYEITNCNYKIENDNTIIVNLKYEKQLSGG